MSLKNKNIFIVEDNVGNLAVASVYLEQEGAKIKVERRGIKTAQAVLRSLPVDIILTDLMLPNSVSGFDIFDQIRAVPELAAIPIVAVSAADPDVAMPRARQKGFAGYIAKPITPRITAYVTAVLEGKQIWIADSDMLYTDQVQRGNK
jgi:CheY-like chemotaxis protein